MSENTIWTCSDTRVSVEPFCDTLAMLVCHWSHHEVLLSRNGTSEATLRCLVTLGVREAAM